MKTKLLIGAAAMFAALSNVAVAGGTSITLIGPVGYKDFFALDGYSLNPRTKIMEMIIVPKKNCEKMYASFDAEKDGIVESLGGYFDLMNTQPGRKIRNTMITDLKLGGTLELKSVTCYNNNNRSIETLDSKKGYSLLGGSRPAF